MAHCLGGTAQQEVGVDEQPIAIAVVLLRAVGAVHDPRIARSTRRIKRAEKLLAPIAGALIDAMGSMGTTVAVLWCVLGAALIGLALFSRRRGPDGVRYRLTLETKRSIYVVEIAGRNLVVGSSEAGIQLLAELDADAMKKLPVVEPSPQLRWKRA